MHTHARCFVVIYTQANKSGAASFLALATLVYSIDYRMVPIIKHILDDKECGKMQQYTIFLVHFQEYSPRCKDRLYGMVIGFMALK